jgi:hypothetical protein
MKNGFLRAMRSIIFFSQIMQKQFVGVWRIDGDLKGYAVGGVRLNFDMGSGQ